VKKFAAISLLLLLMFNFVGYRLLFSYLQQKANNTIVAKIDKEAYNNAELITLTVPLSMPYLQDSKDFESKDGEITLNGKIYHYVKQKISQGNLILMCLPDEQKTHLQNAKDDFFKLANELQNNSSSKKSGEHSQIIKLVISDYEQLQATLVSSYSIQIAATFYTDASFALLKGEGIMPEQPPEA
jgi:hypothetical protein